MVLSFLFGVAALASFALETTYALPTISVTGAKFFANGQQFFLKGVAYQGTPSDPLVDTNQCQLDANYMKSIGTNSIRVYHVDPWLNHDGCMSAFNEAGIYVWLDLDTFNTSVVQTAPEWTPTQLAAFAQVMDVFQGYKNLGGFWIGNEVINTATGSSAAPYVKAAVADMKLYMATKKYRQIPIGYSAADIAELRPMLQNYLACGDPSTAIDFFGLNSYEWCGDATYQTSGYSNLQAMSQGYNIPIFFSETGCNVGGERTFQDQNAIFGNEMINTWSGSIIYEWVEESNNYGLVTYANGQIYNGAPIPIQPDYDNLQGVWQNINPTGVAENSYTPSFSAPACPMPSNGWAVNGDVPLPTLGASVVNALATKQLITQAPAPTSTYVAQAENMTLAGTTNPNISPSAIPVLSSQVSRSSTSETPEPLLAISTGQAATNTVSSTTSSSTIPTLAINIPASQVLSPSSTASASHSAADRVKLPPLIANIAKFYDVHAGLITLIAGLVGIGLGGIAFL